MTKTGDAELADPTFTDRTIADSSASERVQTERRAVLDRVRASAQARRLDGHLRHAARIFCMATTVFRNEILTAAF